MQATMYCKPVLIIYCFAGGLMIFAVLKVANKVLMSWEERSAVIIKTKEDKKPDKKTPTVLMT